MIGPLVLIVSLLTTILVPWIDVTAAEDVLVACPDIPDGNGYHRDLWNTTQFGLIDTQDSWPTRMSKACVFVCRYKGTQLIVEKAFGTNQSNLLPPEHPAVMYVTNLHMNGSFCEAMSPKNGVVIISKTSELPSGPIYQPPKTATCYEHKSINGEVEVNVPAPGFFDTCLTKIYSEGGDTEVISCPANYVYIEEGVPIQTNEYTTIVSGPFSVSKYVSVAPTTEEMKTGEIAQIQPASSPTKMIVGIVCAVLGLVVVVVLGMFQWRSNKRRDAAWKKFLDRHDQPNGGESEKELIEPSVVEEGL